MNRYSLLALGLALTLSCAGSRANDQAGAVGTDNQPGAASANQQPPTAPTTPQPDIAQPTPQPDNGQGNQQPNADQTNPQPDNGQVNPQPNVGQPNPQPDNGQAIPQPNTGQPGAVGNAQQGAMASPDIHSPLQEFVSHQVDEVASLAPQFDAFRAANRADAIPVLYHMVRDHVLVADAARNLLARRGQISRPVTLAPAMDVVAVTPDDMLRHDIEAHQQALSSTQQLLANSTSPEERNIYQQAVNATQKHLGWLQSLSQGQQVALGFFEPTIPLNRIAGYREQVGQARTGRSSQQIRRSRTASYRRGMRSRSHRHHYYHRYYRGTSRYR
jgi:hypothetical protein